MEWKWIEIDAKANMQMSCMQIRGTRSGKVNWMDEQRVSTVPFSANLHPQRIPKESWQRCKNPKASYQWQGIGKESTNGHRGMFGRQGGEGGERGGGRGGCPKLEVIVVTHSQLSLQNNSLETEKKILLYLFVAAYLFIYSSFFFPLSLSLSLSPPVV